MRKKCPTLKVEARYLPTYLVLEEVRGPLARGGVLAVGDVRGPEADVRAPIYIGYMYLATILSFWTVSGVLGN